MFCFYPTYRPFIDRFGDFIHRLRKLPTINQIASISATRWLVHGAELFVLERHEYICDGIMNAG